MAYEAKQRDGAQRVIAISRKEAVELIALLAGQIADEPAPNNHAGAAPELKIIDRGAIVERIGFVVDDRTR